VIEVGTLRGEEAAALLALKRVAFGGRPGPTALARDTELFRPRVERGDVLAAREHGEVVGSAELRPYRQWFAGRALPMTGLGGVVVAPHARRRGVAATLLARAIERMHEAGAAVSALFPSSPPVYRAAGWETAGGVAGVEVATADLRRPTSTRTVGLPEPAGVDVRLRPLAAAAETAAETTGTGETGEDTAPGIATDTAADIAAVHALYTAAARPAVGPLTRTGPLFDPARILELDGVVIAEVDGAPAGYVSWSRAGGPIDVHDLVGDGPAVYGALLDCVGSWHTTIRSARIRLADPALLTVVLPFEPAVSTEPWMLRVVDAEAAVAGRGFGAVDTTVAFELVDPLAPWQAGPWLLEVTDGDGRLSRSTGRRTAEARVHVRGFSALFTGYASTGSLRAAGLVDGPPAALARLDAVFAGPAPWMLDSF
jgi:predicted acetyltransferase